MVADGLEEEARTVWPLKGLNSLNTVGLKEMFDMFEGKMERAVAIERIKKNTRVYAKKQLTWYKRDPEILRLDISKATAGELADRVIDIYNSDYSSLCERRTALVGGTLSGVIGAGWSAVKRESFFFLFFPLIGSKPLP